MQKSQLQGRDEVWKQIGNQVLVETVLLSKTDVQANLKMFHYLKDVG